MEMERNNEKGKEIEKIDNISMEIPSGFKFKPRDREVITDYLLPMVKNRSLPWEDVIIRRSLYGIDQEDISSIFEECSLTSRYYDEDEDSLYFYTPLIKVSEKAKRICRVAGPGTWKGQDTGKAIYDEQGTVIGFKKLYSFTTKEEDEASSSSAPVARKRKTSSSTSSNSNWIMHEYSLPSASSSSSTKNVEHVICKIRRKCAPRSSSPTSSMVEEVLEPPVPLLSSSPWVPVPSIRSSPTTQSVTTPEFDQQFCNPYFINNMQPMLDQQNYNPYVNTMPPLFDPQNYNPYFNCMPSSSSSTIPAPSFDSSPIEPQVISPMVDQQNYYNSHINHTPSMTTMTMTDASFIPLTTSSNSEFASSTESAPTDTQAVDELDDDDQLFCDLLDATLEDEEDNA